MSRAVDTARTWLFVPGSRPDRFDKAVAAGADMTIVDLEDSVAPADKTAARDAVVQWLDRRECGGPAGVRINAADTPWHEDDLTTLTGRADVIMVAKAEPGAMLEAVGRVAAVVALVETATGVLDARAIARTPGVRRLALGSFDLATALGVDPRDSAALNLARSALVLASADAGLPAPIDGVHAAIDDVDALALEAEAARRLGFAGKLTIHPRQVRTVANAFTPSPDEIAWATRVLATVTDSTDAVVTIDGRMVDKPLIERSRRIMTDPALSQEECRA